MAKVRILIVDDDIMIAEDIQFRLRRLGYDVCGIATTGKEALEKVNDNRPDSVLMDIFLPGNMDGIEAAEKIRMNYDIPVIYISAYTDDVILQRAKITEPYGYIIKPFKDRELQTTIEIALYKHKMEKKLKIGEKNLRESEERFRKFFENEPDYCYMISPQGKILDVNRTALKVLGYSKKELIGKSLKTIFAPESQLKLKTVLSRFEKEGKLSDEELVIRTKTGVTRSILLSADLIKDKDGKIINSISVQKDITKRKRVEEELKKRTQELVRSNELIMSLSKVASQMETISEPERIMKTLRASLKQFNLNYSIALSDKDNQELIVRYYSIGSVVVKQVEKLLGMKANNFRISRGRVRNWNIVFEKREAFYSTDLRNSVKYAFPDLSPTVIDRLLKLIGITPEVTSLHLPLIAKDNVLGVFSLWGSDIKKEDIPIFSVFANQVAVALNSAKLYTALSVSETKFRTVMESANDAIISADIKGKIISWNKGAQIIFGYAEQEVLGKPLVLLIPEQYREAHQQGIKRLQTTGKSPVIGKTIELVGLRKDRSEFPIGLSLSQWKVGSDKYFTAIIRDITERKLAEETLRESEERYRSTINSMQHLIFNIDKDGIFESYHQPAGSKLFAPPEVFVGKKYETVLPPDVAASLTESIKAISEGKQSDEFEYSLTMDKQEYWFNAVITGRYDAGGNLTGVTVVVHDVTGRKKVLEALSKNEAKYRSIVESSHEIIWTTDRAGVFTFVNHRGYEITGHKTESVIGMKSADYIHPDDLESARRHFIKVVYKGEVQTFELRILDKNGEYVTLLVTEVPIFENGKVEEVLAFGLDITDRKLMEQELRESEEKYRSIFESLTDIYFRTDKDLRVTVISPSVSALGYEPEKCVGMKASEFYYDKDEFYDFVKQLEDFGEVNDYELRFRKTGGELVNVSANVRMLYDKKGCPDGMECILRDITERKQVEQEIRLLLTITQAIDEARDFQSALGITLTKVCEATSWDLGEAWIPDQAKAVLEFSPTWYCRNKKLDNFIKASKKFTFISGLGLPGKVWASRKPIWISDVSKEVDAFLLRTKIATEAGLKAALGVPIIANKKVLAILSFFMFENREEDDHLVELVSIVAAQLGSVIHRKQIEGALKESEEKFRRVIEQSNDGIYVLLGDRFVFVNHRFTEITGYQLEEISGEDFDFRQLIAEEGLKVLSEREAMRERGEEPPNRYVFKGLTKDGKKIDLEVSISAMDWDDQPATLGILRDVTERIKARQEIDRLANFPSENPAPVVELTAQCKLTYINPACKTLLKQMNLDITDINQILPKDCKKIVYECLKEGINIKAQEVKVGDQVLLWSGHPLPELNLVHYYATDITELKKTEAELIEAKNKAEQSERVKSLFLANMSHEIRTPLNSILGFSELIEQSAGHLIGSEEQRFFDMIRRSGKRLVRTIHEILDMSQIEAGTFVINQREVQLNTLVRGVIQELKPQAQSKNLKITFNSKVDGINIYADEFCVFQALTNIIDNAIKYTDEGEIEVLIEPKVKNKEKDGQFILSIKDTGIGMSDEYLDQLFEIFSQESTGYTKKFQGLGLGLALAKRYLEMNDITIDVQSQKGVGSTFILTFSPAPSGRPEIVKEKKIEENRMKVSEKSQSKPMILVVEDDVNSQKLMLFFLKKNYNACFASSVAGAKEKLNTEPVSLILLDLSLEGDEDGLDLTRYLRKTEKWKDIPIIAVTAHAFVSDREKTLEAGCNDYMTKPVKQNKLLEKIEYFLKH